MLEYLTVWNRAVLNCGHFYRPVFVPVTPPHDPLDPLYGQRLLAMIEAAGRRFSLLVTAEQVHQEVSAGGMPALNAFAWNLLEDVAQRLNEPEYVGAKPRFAWNPHGTQIEPAPLTPAALAP